MAKGCSWVVLKPFRLLERRPFFHKFSLSGAVCYANKCRSEKIFLLQDDIHNWGPTAGLAESLPLVLIISHSVAA